MTPIQYWTIGWAITFVFIGIETTIKRDNLIIFFGASILSFFTWPIGLPFLLFKAFKRQ